MKTNGREIDPRALKDALSLKGYARGIMVGRSTFVKLPPAWVRRFGKQMDGSTLVEITFEAGVAHIRCLTKEEVAELVRSSPPLYKSKPVPEAKAVPTVQPKAEETKEKVVDPSALKGIIQCDGILPPGELRLGERLCPYSEGGKTCGRAIYARIVCKFSEVEWRRMAGKHLPRTMAEARPKEVKK